MDDSAAPDLTIAQFLFHKFSQATMKSQVQLYTLGHYDNLVALGPEKEMGAFGLPPVSGFFGGPGYVDFLFYPLSDAAGSDQFLSVTADSSLVKFGECSAWKGFPRVAVSGRFTDQTDFTCLFLYDSAGAAQFFSTDGKGTLEALGPMLTDLRTSWHIVPGHFDLNRDITDLLFFDWATGEFQFYTTDGKGQLEKIGDQNSGFESISQVIPGNFGGGTGCTDLLFFDRQAGWAQFYRTSGEGKVEAIGDPVDGLGSDWIIYAGIFTGRTIFSDLLFYNPGGRAQFYTTDGKGGLEPIDGIQSNWPQLGQLVPITMVR